MKESTRAVADRRTDPPRFFPQVPSRDPQEAVSANDLPLPDRRGSARALILSAFWALWLGGLLAGCSGHAFVSLIPTGPKPIRPTAPLIVEVFPNECYFWVNDQQKLTIAMRAHTGSLWGKRFEREFVLSILLDKPPDGPSRYYHVGRHTLRARNRAGYAHWRVASLGGAVVVWDYGKRNLRGRFRIQAKQQSYLVLTGWDNNQHVLLLGEFTAIPGPQAGQRILAQTEGEGMTRSPPSTKPIRIQGPRKPS